MLAFFTGRLVEEGRVVSAKATTGETNVAPQWTALYWMLRPGAL